MEDEGRDEEEKHDVDDEAVVVVVVDEEHHHHGGRQVDAQNEGVRQGAASSPIHPDPHANSIEGRS